MQGFSKIITSETKYVLSNKHGLKKLHFVEKMNQHILIPIIQEVLPLQDSLTYSQLSVPHTTTPEPSPEGPGGKWAGGLLALPQPWDIPGLPLLTVWVLQHCQGVNPTFPAEASLLRGPHPAQG